MPWPDRELFEGERFRRGLAEAIRRETAEKARRESRSAKDARQRSRSAFATLRPTSALNLARQEFPSLMASDVDSLRLRAGERITGFTAPNAATIVDARGERSMLISSEPLAAGTGDDLKRMDLTLEETGGGFAPAEAAVDVLIPVQSDDFLTVEQAGMGVRPADARSVSATLSENRAFYADIAQDTDYVATPTRAGAEVLWHLRSDDAPEELGLDVDLPDGATMRIASDLTNTSGTAGVGDVEVVRDGEVLSTITAPVAMDADGVSVPASYRFDDGELVVDVPHRGKDLHYPILVDPEVREVWGAHDFLNTCGGGPTDFAPGRWTYGQTASFLPVCGEANGGGVGIFIVSRPWHYVDGQTAYWMWGAPSGAYIADAWFDNLRHQAAGTYLYTGLMSNTAWGSLAFHPSEFLYGQYSQTPDSPYRSWTAVVGLTTANTFTRPHVGIGGVRGVNLRLSDLDAPYGILAEITGGLDYYGQNPWVNDLRTYVQATVRGSDAGLGVHRLGVVRDVTGAVIGAREHGCAGHRSSRCPQDWQTTFPLFLSQLPEGLNSLQARTWDIVGNEHSGPHWTQRIDRTGPDIDISGELVEHATDGQLSPNPGIYVHAKDGSTANASTHRSGVQRVRMLVDGNPVREYVAPEPHCQNCDRGLSWNLPAELLNGDKMIKIEAWDYIGHYSQRSFRVIHSTILDRLTLSTSLTTGPHEAPTADDLAADPDGRSRDAGAAATTGCRWTYNTHWVDLDPTGYVGNVRFRARFCYNTTRKTAWAVPSTFELREDVTLLGQAAGVHLERLDDVRYYNVSHRGPDGVVWPRGGVHMHMRWRAKACALIATPLCFRRPIVNIVTYGYFDGTTAKNRFTNWDEWE